MAGGNAFISFQMAVIRVSQELEEALEDLTSKTEVSHQAMHGKISVLQQQEHELDLELAAENDRIVDLHR